MDREVLLLKRDLMVIFSQTPPYSPFTPPSFARTASRYSLIILNDRWNICQLRIDERVAARSPPTTPIFLLDGDLEQIPRKMGVGVGGGERTTQ